MKKYRKKPVVIEAVQWWKNGDHPEDCCDKYYFEDGNGKVFESPGEGKLVRYHRTPTGNGDKPCGHCEHVMSKHGWIDTLEGGHVVCPGDWIIKGVVGEFYPCKDEIFKQTYDPVENDESETRDG